MNLRTAERMIRAMMDSHGLTDWKISWTRAKKTHGLCNYSTRTLSFSAVAFGLISQEDAYETVLHEIAHALAGHTAGHGPRWVAEYRRIGGKGGQYVSKVASAAVAAQAAWQGKCPKCPKVTAQHRAPLRVKACSCGIRFKPEHVLVWHKNGRRVNPHTISDRYSAEWTRMQRVYGDRLPV